MQGVILWKNKTATKSIIWCDDHDDLAIMEGAITCSQLGVDLVEGDLIEFDLVANSTYRRAWNARKVGAGSSISLSEQLKSQPPQAPQGSPFLRSIQSNEPKTA